MTPTTTFDILIALFLLAMVANAVAFVRHWRMMRVLQICLNNLIETQRQFDELVERERREKAR